MKHLQCGTRLHYATKPVKTKQNQKTTTNRHPCLSFFFFLSFFLTEFLFYPTDYHPLNNTFSMDLVFKFQHHCVSEWFWFFYRELFLLFFFFCSIAEIGLKVKNDLAVLKPNHASHLISDVLIAIDGRFTTESVYQ